MAPELSSTSCEEVAETSPAASTESALASSPSRRPAAAVLATATTVGQSPSSASTVSTSYTLPKTKPVPAPKRTYGKQREPQATLVDDQLPTASLTALPVVPAAPPRRMPLEETTSIVIPETDPTADLTSEGALARSPEDRVKQLAASSSSQAPASQHTTDPTSEEEVGSRSKRPARTFSLNIRDSDSDSSSDAEGAGDAGGVEAFLANKITLDDLDAAVDKLLPVAHSNTGKGKEVAKSSSLPPLTPSTENASQAPHVSSEATPVRTSHDEQLPQARARALVVDSSGSQTAPSRAPRRRHRIVESDESDVDDEHQAGRDRKDGPADAAAAGDVQDQLPTPVATSALGESRKERLKHLAEKRRNKEQLEAARGRSGKGMSTAKGAIVEEEEEEGNQRAPVQEEELVDEVDAIMNEASTEKKGRNGLISKKRKSKGLSKKEQEEMEKTAAAQARKVDVSLAPTTRHSLSVTDVFKKRPLATLPPPPVRHIGRASTPPATRSPINLADAPSSDSIQDSDNGPASTTPYALKRRNVEAGSERSPRSDDIDQTPVPVRRTATSLRPLGNVAKPEFPKKAVELAAPPAVVDDDEGLEAIDLGAELKRASEKQERARIEQERQEKRRQLQAKKLAALRASQAKVSSSHAQDSDSGSDLEIEGAPQPKKNARRSRSPSAEVDTLAEYASKLSRRAQSPALDMLRHFARSSSVPLGDDAEPSDSQFKAAGQTFGANLDPRMTYRTSGRKSRKQPPPIVTLESQNERLQRLAREQAAEVRQKKQLRHRQAEQNRAGGPKQLESVNIGKMVEEKKHREEEDAQMEEDADADYVDEASEKEYNSADFGSDGEDDDDDDGSGSDVPVAHGRVAVTTTHSYDDDELDSEGEPVLPKSSQNDDRLGKASRTGELASDAEDEDEDSMLPPAFSRKSRQAVRIADDEEEADDEESARPVGAVIVGGAEAVTPKQTRVDLGGLLGDIGEGDGGFSQFFDSQFSPGGDEASVGGFLRRDDEVFEPPAPTMFAVQPLISTAERAQDAARLEARGGFNDLEPATPREVAAPRQYINEKGLLTQTRPAANFDSPSDTPPRTQRQTYSTLDSQSQVMEETQVATAQTPTQVTQRAGASQRPNALRRTEALSNLGSVAKVGAPDSPAGDAMATTDEPETQLDETQVDGETQDESQDARPSAAQPPAASPRADAFALLRAGAERDAEPAVTRPSKLRKAANAFIDTEANLSDEEGERPFGGVSDDENEDDHDQELAELVDNKEEDEAVVARQDEEATKLHRENEEKREAEDLARAQRIAAGKERNKRGRGDLSDDDFDDDYVRPSDREKRTRVNAESIDDLKANEETRTFGDVLEKACAPEPSVASWLNVCQDDELAEEDEDMDDGAADVFGPKPAAINPYDARSLALNLQRDRNDAGQSAVGDPESILDEHISARSPPLPGYGDSSPSRAIEINDRLASASAGTKGKKRVVQYSEIESQSLYATEESLVQYSAVGGDESQSKSAAVTSSRSAITSFKRTEKSKPKTMAAGAGVGGGSTSSRAKTKAKGAPLAAKPSRLGNWRKGTAE
ncbi:hypothetical protein JCM3774_001009 [Rhodotorula dairenensis]